MNINQLKQLLNDQKAAFLKKKDLIKREIAENYQDLTQTKQIIVVTGIRRAGKSSLLKLIATELLDKQQIDERQIFYVNFEDEFFVDFTKDDFNSLLSAYYEINQPKPKKIYCFFDEIQNVKYWEKWINKLYENSDFKIFITGSNSSLLSGEIASALTGRNYTMEIFPFSFREYLLYQKIALPPSLDALTTDDGSRLKKELDIYLSAGGFPEAIGNPLDILEENYKNIIYKDIVVRFGIKNVAEFRSLSLYLLSNICSLMSYRSLVKITGDLQSSMTVKNYISYLSDSYLLFVAKKLDASVKKQLVAPFKIYSIDNGLARSVAFSLSQNYNKLYENIVYLALRRKRGIEIFYWQNRGEVDFVAMEKNNIKDIIQVCYDLTDTKTKDREISALVEALDFFQKKQGLLINNYLDKEEIINGKKIIFTPLYKFLLEYS